MTKDNGLNFNYLEELKNIKTVTQGDTDYADALIEVFGKENENLILGKTSFLAFKELAQDDVQALVGDRGVNEYFARYLPNTKFISHPIKNEGYEKYTLHIVVSKQHPELLKKINTGLQQLIDDGSYKDIYSKWFQREAEIPQ